MKLVLVGRHWLNAAVCSSSIQTNFQFRLKTWMTRIAWGLAFASLFLTVHNFGFSLLPEREQPMNPAMMRSYSAGKNFAYIFPFNDSKSDTYYCNRSRTRIFENGTELVMRQRTPDEATLAGGGRWCHQENRIIFSSSDLTDPRTNGRRYSVRYPVLYTRSVGLGALVTFVVATIVLYRAKRNEQTTGGRITIEAVPVCWKTHLVVATGVLVLGLYVNTGTLSPYGASNWPYVDTSTGYLYNTDHPHYRVLFYFVDGQEKAKWHDALMLRRVLYPVIAWPAMKLAGFELGGTVTSIALNIAAFLAIAVWIQRRIGTNAAVVALWLLALYPGFGYWGTLPYPYAITTVLILILTLSARELAESAGPKFWALSVAMGVSYLAYDFIVYFVPCSVLLLLWRRRPWAAISTALVQIAPLAAWLCCLRFLFHESLETGNSALYLDILKSYRDVHLSEVFSNAIDAVESGADVFFGSNFLFLPSLFLTVLLLNLFSSRIRFLAVEVSLFFLGFALLLFNNLGPHFGNPWDPHGTWFARVYQPVLGGILLFIIRWWNALPPTKLRWVYGTLIGVTCLANAVIVLGPITNDPSSVSTYAIYRFYNHTDNHWILKYQLKQHGRRPLGFPRPEQ